MSTKTITIVRNVLATCLLPLRIGCIGWGEGSRVRCSPFLPLILLLLSLSLLPAPAAVFTTNLTITETNLAYDGQDIVISGATVAIDGPHAFDSPYDSKKRSNPLARSAVFNSPSCVHSRPSRCNVSAT